MINALAHRDYSLVDPTRITVFLDRIEMISPGPLPTGVNPEDFRAGRVAPKWRNQALAWFLSRPPGPVAGAAERRVYPPARHNQGSTLVSRPRSLFTLILRSDQSQSRFQSQTKEEEANQ
ncbi:MAG TPA: ATP-binding protein [Thermoanaerobaculia bacterium]|jgi:predicted HTH transcriptional regulator|nr:ATP-binding protein [Thermoanaerobaculia bacterium]